MPFSNAFDKLPAMQTVTRSPSRQRGRLTTFIASLNAAQIAELATPIGSGLLLILSFPDYNLWPLAWIALAPLLVFIARRPSPRRSFLRGWLFGSVFFYGSCYWLTFSMIHYGGIPGGIAYLLLIPGALIVGLFPGLFGFVLAIAVRLFRNKGVLLAPFIWVACEWARLGVTGQLWNALGYSQAYEPLLIQPARWGGVYAVSFLIVTINAAVAFVGLNRCWRAGLVSATLVVLIIALMLSSDGRGEDSLRSNDTTQVIALQPNVPMTLVKTPEELRDLTARHVRMTEEALSHLPNTGGRRLVVWPESPMNFTYANDSLFRELVDRFTREHHVSLLLNSQEPAPNNGIYNSAILINEEGRLVGQYDKIRLLPFGEYVPLPRWLPGATLITGIVGDFEPGANYTLFPIGEEKVGVFICIESAYPSIARSFAAADADVLINISNDGYLGRTGVIKQHLANAVFRAVENGRPILRVTNTGITARITPQGEVQEATNVFEPAVRTWTIGRSEQGQTFYTRHGDVLAFVSTLVTALVFVAWLLRRGKKIDLEKA
jgi:apolipoprotein N-acyltransferase